MNQFTAVGRLIADPEGKTTQTGKFVATCAISVNRPERPKPGEKYPPSDVFNFEVWGDRGEALVNMANKGAHIWIIGRHESRKDENNRVWWTVKFCSWGFAGPKSTSAPSGHDDETGF